MNSPPRDLDIMWNIVHALAQCHRAQIVRVVAAGELYRCNLCNAPVGNPVESAHDDACPWKMARQFVRDCIGDRFVLTDDPALRAITLIEQDAS